MAPELPIDQQSINYPLFNTSFTIQRLSPLHTGGRKLTNAILQQHATRFRDILVGDVLRGVRVGLRIAGDDDILARIGVLRSVIWRELKGDEEDLEGDNDRERSLDVDGDMTMESQMSGLSRGMRSGKVGILIEITYEKAKYTAILLRSVGNGGGDTEGNEARSAEEKVGFENFPLLATRMPGSLRETFTEYISSTFDARVSILHLSRGYLITALENYIVDSMVDEDGEAVGLAESSAALRAIIKDIQVTIGFDLTGGPKGLKTIDFHIDQQDLPRLMARGKKVTRDKSGEGKGDTPFMDALTSYVKARLALDLRHEKVRIVKIACGGFVLGSEGKVKLTAPLGVEGRNGVQRRATWRLVNGLIGAAKGRGMATGFESP